MSLTCGYKSKLKSEYKNTWKNLAQFVLNPTFCPFYATPLISSEPSDLYTNFIFSESFPLQH